MPESLIIDTSEVRWHHFDDPEDPELTVLAASYSLHELALEDCASISTRPKLDDYGDYVFAILNGPRFVPEQDRVEDEKLCVFVAEDYIVTVSHGENRAVTYTRSVALSGHRYSNSKEILHALMDYVCDRFLPTIDDVAEEIADLELRALEKPGQAISRRATSLKKLLTSIRRLAVSHREIINQLLRKHPAFVDARLNLYFRDIYDHLVQATELTETNRDLLSGIIDINLASTAHRTNEIVKTLTIYATALLPLNVITGYFGMNFDSLPGLGHPLGVPMVTMFMFFVVAASFLYFREQQW